MEDAPMTKLFQTLVVAGVLLISCAGVPAVTAELAPAKASVAVATGDAARAQARLDRAVTDYQKSPSRALGDFSMVGPYLDGDLYVYVVGANGVLQASGGSSVTLVGREQGLMVPRGNPKGIRDIADLARSDVRFVNRQPGSGTRVWLDGALKRLGIPHEEIAGSEIEKLSHSEVARAVAEGKANAGFGLETSARVYGLDFILLTQETYHLVLLASMLEHPAVQALLEWLVIPQVKAAIAGMGGYDTAHCGEIEILAA